ncbi:MAG: hypothetical protein KF862_12755 [Chitinophagaceae bacterium]|nr:hypothetical protein [Chitinophagaceae bacterium]
MIRLSFATVCFSFFFGFINNSSAQIANVAKSKISEGTVIVGELLKNKITDNVRLIGLGEFQNGLREPLKLNTAIATYLILERRFNIVAISIPDWEIRDLNNYLIDSNTIVDKARFDLLYKQSFIDTDYYTEECKDFIFWLKQHNIRQNIDKVRLVGVGNIVGNPQKFPQMNDYFVETYARPYNKTIADSLKTSFSRFGNSSNRTSDSLILAFLGAYINIAQQADVIPSDQLEQLKFDYQLRLNAFEIINAPIDLTQRMGRMMHLNSIVEAQSIDNLLQKSNKNRVILFSQNSNLVNAFIKAYSPNASQPYLIPRNGGWYKEKYKEAYFSTVTTFADSANIIGTQKSLRYRPITIYGDKIVKDLLRRRDVYCLPDDSTYLSSYVLPIINSGLLGGEEIKIVMEPMNNRETTPFNLLFIFNTLTRAKTF